MSTGEQNPWVGVNYLPDNERMPIPPAWFMQRIWDQDAMLVVLPSRRVLFAYVIARRKQFGPGLTEAAIDAQYSNPDTKMCILYGCVPVCLMYKTGPTWDADTIISKLQARDLWAHGGADKVTDMLEAEEDAEKQRLRKQIRDELWERSGEGWRTYQHRTGQSTIRSKDHVKAVPRKGRRIYSNSPTTIGATGSGLSEKDT
jgi:hypothetical protein